MSQGLPIDETQWLPEGAGPASCPDSAPGRRGRLPQPLFQATSLFNRSLHALLDTISAIMPVLSRRNRGT